MLEPRTMITFDLTPVKGEAKTGDPGAHASTADFCKIINTHSHAIFSFNILLLFTMRRRRRDESKDYRNNNNDENKRKGNNDDKNKRSDENDKNDKG